MVSPPLSTEQKYICEAIEDYWGKKCPDYDPDCSTCRVWEEFEGMVRCVNEMNGEHIDTISLEYEYTPK